MTKDLALKRRLLMVRSLVKETVKWARFGFKTRTEEEQLEVIAICEQCKPYYTKSILGPRCSECGCCLHIKKRWITANCPKEKW